MVETPIIAKIEGKTTPFGFTVRLEQSVNRTAFLFCEHEKTEYILGVQRVWKDSKGSYASVRVVGQVPQTPFNISTEIRLASDSQIQTALGLSLAPEKSLFVGKLLHTSIEVGLNIEKLGRVFITGKSGSGKSYTVGVFIEELLRKKVPVLVIDRHGEYSSLKVLQKDQIPDTEEFFKKDDPERNFAQGIIEFGDPTLNPGVDLTLDDLMLCESKDLINMGQCTLVNLRGLELSRQEEVADWVLKKVYKSSTHRETPSCYIFIDEAHQFAGKKVASVVETLRLIAQEGRKFGANVVIITQKPQLLDTTIRAQAGTWIIHKLTDINDVKITVNSAEGLSTLDIEEIQMLSPGEAIISGELTPLTPLRIKVRPRYTVHGAPGYNILKELSEADLSKRATISERLKEKLQHLKESVNNPISQESVEEMDQITQLQKENNELKEKVAELESQLKTPQAQLLLPTPPEQKDELQGERKKNEQEPGTSQYDELKSENQTLQLEISGLQMQITDLKEKHQKEQQRADEAIKLAEKLMTEYRKRK